MTTHMPIPKLLKEYLDHLDKDMLKEFQWYLVQIEIDGSRPIPKSKLPEKATRETTVDKLVEAFGEDGAVERTVDTFFQMNLNGLASKLVQAKADQSREQKEEEPETSSAGEEPREVDPTVPKDLSRVFADPVVQQFGQFCWPCAQNNWKRKILREGFFPKQCIPEVDMIFKYRNHTEPFQTRPKNIREKQEALKKVKQWRDSSIEDILTQSFNTETEIMYKFKCRHASLDKEEMTERAALREETRQKICWITDRTEEIFLLYDTDIEIGTFRADKTFTEVFKVLMLCVLLAVGIGLATFGTTDSFIEASGKPSSHSLGEDAEQHKSDLHSCGPQNCIVMSVCVCQSPKLPLLPVSAPVLSLDPAYCKRPEPGYKHAYIAD